VRLRDAADVAWDKGAYDSAQVWDQLAGESEGREPWSWASLPGMDGGGPGMRWPNGQYMRYWRVPLKVGATTAFSCSQLICRAWLTSERRPEQVQR